MVMSCYSFGANYGLLTTIIPLLLVLLESYLGLVLKLINQILTAQY